MTDISAVFDQAPFIDLVGYRLERYGEGWAETSLQLRPEHLQQHGYVHAGVITTMADHTAGGAASTVVAEGQSVLTAQLGIHLLRPSRGLSLRCRGEVVKAGRRLVVAEADVHCDDIHVARLSAMLSVVDQGLGGGDA